MGRILVSDKTLCWKYRIRESDLRLSKQHGLTAMLVIITSMLRAGSLSPMIMAYWALSLGLEQEVFKAAVPMLSGLGWSWATPLLNDGLRRLWAGWIDKWGGRRK